MHTEVQDIKARSFIFRVTKNRVSFCGGEKPKHFTSLFLLMEALGHG